MGRLSNESGRWCTLTRIILPVYYSCSNVCATVCFIDEPVVTHGSYDFTALQGNGSNTSEATK
jgi:hypothetical protein